MADRRIVIARQRLEKEIDRLGQEFVVSRIIYTSDGMNGNVASDTPLSYTLKGMLKSYNQVAMPFVITDGGRKCSITNSLTVLFDEALDIKLYDTLVVDSNKLTIVSIDNLGEQNLCYVIALTTEVEVIEKYGE